MVAKCAGRRDMNKEYEGEKGGEIDKDIKVTTKSQSKY